jgi:hypothetical protein
MNIDAIKSKVKFYTEKALAFFPETLPQGQTEFDTWLDSIQALFKLPTSERSDLIQVFSSIIINLGPLQDKKSKYYFVKAIRLAAAKQVAGARFLELQQAARAKREAQAKTVEATTNLKVVPSDGPTAG